MVSVTAIIQARMGSTRSPSKSLRPIAGLPMLEHIIIRLKQVPEIDLILLAIPEKESESPLIEFARRLPIPVFQGPEEDVLGRFIKAGESVQTEQVVRVCGDDPPYRYTAPKFFNSGPSAGQGRLYPAPGPRSFGKRLRNHSL